MSTISQWERRRSVVWYIYTLRVCAIVITRISYLKYLLNNIRIIILKKHHSRVNKLKKYKTFPTCRVEMVKKIMFDNRGWREYLVRIHCSKLLNECFFFSKPLEFDIINTNVQPAKTAGREKRFTFIGQYTTWCYFFRPHFAYHIIRTYIFE